MTEVASGNGEYIIRRAMVDEIDILVGLRLFMFQAMGFDDEAMLHRVGEACRDYFGQHLPTGQFQIWVAEAESVVIASIGLVMHSIPPSPKNLVGKEAYLMNLVTLPEWRHRGIARGLLTRVLRILREEDIPMVSLHAAADGRRLYEDLGFMVLENVPEMILKLKS